MTENPDSKLRHNVEVVTELLNRKPDYPFMELLVDAGKQENTLPGNFKEAVNFLRTEKRIIVDHDRGVVNLVLKTVADPTAALKVWDGEFSHVRVQPSQYGPYEIVTARGILGAEVMVVSGRSVLLVKQYRPPINASIWELPGGAADYPAGLEVNGAREVQEETGVTVDPTDFRLLTISYPMASLVECETHVFFTELPENYDLDPVVHQEEELEAAGWVDIDHVFDTTRNGSQEYSSVVGFLLQAQLMGFIK